MIVMLACGKTTEQMHDYWCRKGSGDSLNETASTVNSIKTDGKQNISHSCFTVPCQMERRKKETGSVIFQYWQGILLPMQAVFILR